MKAIEELVIEELKAQYELVCVIYISKFCAKQEMEFEGWVGNIVGDIACCNDFFFNFSDIMFDINTNQQKGNIVDWYYENVENHGDSINYLSYTKGLRISNIQPKTLNECWLSKIKKANENDLIRFIFKYKNEWYCSAWNKNKWNEPYKIREL